MLKLAIDSGGRHLLSNKVVASLMIDGTTDSVTGVNTVCTSTGAVESFRAPYVALAASAFESVRILLSSRSERSPKGLGNNNGLVGTRILEHVMHNVANQLP